MQLSKKEIEKFKKIHAHHGGLEKYSEKEIQEIANGVANYYLTLHKIHERTKKEQRLKNRKGNT